MHDCSALLVSDQNTAGYLGTDYSLAIMDEINQYQERAYDKLYRWIQVEVRCMKEESPDVAPELLRGISCLRNRPILFEYRGLTPADLQVTCHNQERRR
jgi:conserved oligomeric Golgi complex subunit 6